MAIPAAEFAAVAQWGRGTPFNDFYDYYFAAKLVAEGRSPYDSVALAEMARQEGVDLTLGSGYSYPLPFAIAMLPFTVLPVAAAALVFSALSLLAFGLGVAAWLRRACGDTVPRRGVAAVALLAGAYPPVFGSLFSGQANLLVFGLFAAGVLLVVARRDHPVAGGVAIGLAAVVKLVPGAVAVPLLLARRWREGIAVIVAFAAAVLGAAVVAPSAAAGSARLIDLVAPDPFFTNQSINGFLSRLVLSSERSVALAPAAFDPFVVALVLVTAFGLVNVALLLRARGRLGDAGVLANSIGLVLAAAVIAAPKNSFWNQVVLLAPVGLILLEDGRVAALRGRDAVERALLVTWFATAVVQQALWAAAPPAAGSMSWVLTLAYSSALYGAIALWLLFARRVHRAMAAVPTPTAEPVTDRLVSSRAGGLSH